MATWNSRGLRGSTLEDLINRTIEQYREKGLALIQKEQAHHRPPSRPLILTRKAGILHLLILKKRVP